MAIITNDVTDILPNTATCGGVVGDDSNLSHPIVDWLLKNKWQLYNKSRQKLTTNIKSTERVRPLQLFYDYKQSGKQFVMGGIRYNLTTDIYVVDFYEYDNLTEINLT